MNLPSKDIIDYLVDESSLDLSFKINIFNGIQPAKPNNAVTIKDTPGGVPEKTFNGASGYFRPTVQILVRNTHYEDAYTVIDNIKNILDGLGPITINNTRYTYIECIVEPFSLGQDENGHFIFTTTFDLQRTT
jgi:hypothetical protein